MLRHLEAPTCGSRPVRRSAAWALATTLATWLALLALQRVMSLVFVLNFSVEGPGPSLALVLMLVSASPYLVPALRRRFLGPWAVGAGLMAGALAVLVPAAPPVLALAASGLSLALVAAPLHVGQAALGPRSRHAIAAGVLLHLAFQALLGTLHVDADPMGIWLLAGVVLAFAGALLLAPPARLGTPIWAPASLHAYLFIQAGFLGSAAAVASWNGAAPDAYFAALALGVVAGAAIRSTTGLVPLFLIQGFALIALLGFGGLGWPSLVAFTLQGATTALLGPRADATPGPPGPAVGRAVIVQAVGAVLLLLHGLAPHWAFLPAVLGDLAHGTAAWSLLALGLLPLIVAFLAWIDAAVRLDALRPRLRSGPAALLPVLHAMRQERRLPRGFAAFALVVLLVALPAPHAGPEPSVERTLRVVSYNLHQGYAEHPEGAFGLHAARDVLQAADADVIGLQESDTSRVTSRQMDAVDWLAGELGMHAVRGPPTREQTYGVALLTRHPVLSSDWQHLPRQESTERVLLHTVLAAPGGDVHVFTTHFQTDIHARDRLLQARATVDAMAGLDRVVLLGDLNTEAPTGNASADLAYRLLDEGRPPAEGLTDAWTLVPGDDPGNTDPASDPVRRIDHVWFRGHWQVVGGRVMGGPEASDHLAVVIDLAPA